VPKFKVYANSIQRFFIIIEAETEGNALQKAQTTDGGDFETVDDGDWQIEDDAVEEINDN